MNEHSKLIKSGSITIEEAAMIKSEAEQVLAIARIANKDRVKPIRIDSKTFILVKINKDNALEKYIAKRQKYADKTNK